MVLTVLFNETFTDIRDKQRKIIKHGRTIDPDLQEEMEQNYDYQDEIVPANSKTKQVTIPNRYSVLADPTTTPKAAQNVPVASVPVVSTTKPTSTKNWHYVPVAKDSTREDRRNDGPKNASFFKTATSNTNGRPTRSTSKRLQH
jgi:hypothetical protein